MTVTTEKKQNLLEAFLKEELKKKKFKPGDIVRIHRERLELTQADLSKITLIPAGNISQYETGKKAIGIDIAIKLSAALSIHHDSILFPNGLDEEKKEIKKIKERAIRYFEKKELLSA